MGWNIEPRISRLIQKNVLLDETKALPAHKQVTVISFFGPSQFTSSSNRGKGLKKAFQLAVDVFGSLELLLNDGRGSVDDETQTKENFTTINGIYNEEEGVILLCLDGAFDPNVCLKAFQASPGIRFMSLWSELKCSYTKSLLLLFSVSHLMVLSNVGPYFDTSYIGLFQALERLRHDMQRYFKDELEMIPGLPEAWANQGRICSPRLLLFVPVDSQANTKYSSNSPNAITPLEKFKSKLGNEVYQILRKCRIITNHSGHSLFAVPTDQESEFVFLYDEAVEHGNNLINYIHKFCEISNERIASGLPPKLPTEHLTRRDYMRKFKKFLYSHINAAQNGGFDEDRKYSFILPKLGDWMNAFTKLSDLLLNDRESEDGYGNNVLRKFAQYDPDTEYLEKQLQVHFHKVFSLYSKNLPSHYSHEEQARRVNIAIDSFLQVSTSSAIIPWLEKLTEKCERYWKRGRQQCSSRSLHGKLCINPRHQIQPGDHLEVLPAVVQDETLPKMQHDSGQRLTSYCNCGRRSGFRSEPFTIREANFDFYERFALDCCHKLESFKFPVFQYSQADGKGEGLTLEEMLRIFLDKKEPGAQQEDDDERQISLERDLRQEEDDEEEADLEFQEDRDDFVTESNEEELSTDGKQGQGDGYELDGIENGISGMGLSQNEIPLLLPPVEPLPEVVLPSIPPPPLEVAPTVSDRHEYLPGMLHSRCPDPDLLPLFPSWALIRFGNSSAYAHNIGILHQPDFLVGSNFLLPYDVRVKAPGVSKPIPRKIIMGKTPGKSIKRFEDVFNVKIFIGFEYECRKGHRFMLQSPDKVLSSTRETAAATANSDMPLFFKCPCNTHSTGEKLFAQLMRIHVVTPKAPVFIILKPRVQPGINSPYFFPSKEPLKLTPSAYFQLRLPFNYVSEEEIFSPPTEDGYNGRICKHLIEVVAMTPAETFEWESKCI